MSFMFVSCREFIFSMTSRSTLVINSLRKRKTDENVYNNNNNVFKIWSHIIYVCLCVCMLRLCNSFRDFIIRFCFFFHTLLIILSALVMFLFRDRCLHPYILRQYSSFSLCLWLIEKESSGLIENDGYVYFRYNSLSSFYYVQLEKAFKINENKMRREKHHVFERA